MEVIEAFFSMIFHLFYQVGFFESLSLLCLVLYIFFLLTSLLRGRRS